MSRRISTEKPFLGSGNNEVIGGLCSRGLADAHQTSGFAERTGTAEREETADGRLVHLAARRRKEAQGQRPDAGIFFFVLVYSVL